MSSSDPVATDERRTTKNDSGSAFKSCGRPASVALVSMTSAQASFEQSMRKTTDNGAATVAWSVTIVGLVVTKIPGFIGIFAWGLEDLVPSPVIVAPCSVHSHRGQLSQNLRQLKPRGGSGMSPIVIFRSCLHSSSLPTSAITGVPHGEPHAIAASPIPRGSIAER